MASDRSVREHRVGHLDEAADIGALDVVDGAVAVVSKLTALGVDVTHDLLEPLTDLLA